MEYITRPKHYFPGALSDTAASLLRTIYDAGIWFPEWLHMNHCQAVAFAELQRAAYVESTAYYGYRVKGRDCMEAARQHMATRNTESFIRQAFMSLGIEVSCIRSILPSPNGFSPNVKRWVVIFHRSACLSAERVNTVVGISGAIVKGNVIFVIVG